VEYETTTFDGFKDLTGFREVASGSLSKGG
jgi:hypothetical protein